MEILPPSMVFSLPSIVITQIAVKLVMIIQNDPKDA